MTVLRLLERTAFTAGRASVRRFGLPDTTMRCSVPLLRADGTFDRFALEIEDTGRALLVRECVTRRLPWSCFERHLVDDGYFCLGFEDSWLYPKTDVEARTWWRMLRGYLYCQLDAELTGEWTAPVSWAHGIGAGVQQVLEQYERTHPALVRVVRATSDNRCVDSLPVCRPESRASGSRGSLVADIRSLIVLERKASELFWRGQPVALRCCGSMKRCGLARTEAA